MTKLEQFKALNRKRDLLGAEMIGIVKAKISMEDLGEPIHSASLREQIARWDAITKELNSFDWKETPCTPEA